MEAWLRIICTPRQRITCIDQRISGRVYATVFLRAMALAWGRPAAIMASET